MTGECFCGAIGYRIDGEVKDARSCHCSRCRKAFSSQASSYAVVDPEDFHWTKGEDLLKSYIGEHGAGYRFCGICASTLCGVVNGVVHGITLGCLNEDPGITIQRHIYVGSKATWEVIPEGVVAYEEGPPA